LQKANEKAMNIYNNCPELDTPVTDIYGARWYADNFKNKAANIVTAWDLIDFYR